MKVHPGALKHGISAADAVQAAEWAVWVEPLSEDENPERELRLGFDTQARMLETVVLVFSGGDEMIIHAMPGPQEVPRPAALSINDQLLHRQPDSRR